MRNRDRILWISAVIMCISFIFLNGYKEESSKKAPPNMLTEQTSAENTNLPTMDTSKQSSQINKESIEVTKETHLDIDAPITLKELLQEPYTFRGIRIFDTTYEELVEIMGEPNKTTNILNEDIMLTFGTFVVAEYNNLLVTLNTTDFQLDGSIVVEIDILENFNAINVEELKMHSVLNSKLLSQDEAVSLAVSLKRLDCYEITPTDTDKYYHLLETDSPIGIIFLLRDGNLHRIMYRHFTAG